MGALVQIFFIVVDLDILPITEKNAFFEALSMILNLCLHNDDNKTLFSYNSLLREAYQFTGKI